MQNDRAKFKKEFKERLYRFIISLIGFIDNLPKDRSTNIIGDQLLRSGTSIGANFVEAQASSSKKDFTNFFSYALKSANESKFWLSLLKDTNKANRDATLGLLNELAEISNILGSSVLTLKGRKV